MSYAILSSKLVKRADDGANGPTLWRKGRANNREARRALVLTDEGARNPFRANLPPHISQDLHEIPAESLWRLTADDVRGAVSTYVATFAAVLVFIM